MVWWIGCLRRRRRLEFRGILSVLSGVMGRKRDRRIGVGFRIMLF